MQDTTTALTKPTDLHAPGAVEQLLAWHRAKWAGLVMQVDDPDDDPAPDDDPDDDPAPDDDPDDKLGDAGKKAIDRMKQQRNAAKSELRAFKELGLSVDDIKKLQQTGTRPPSGKSDDEPDLDKIRQEAREAARREAEEEHLAERVTDRIARLATKDFADADDAVTILLREHQVDDFVDGGKPDVDEIKDALKALLEKKPHLAAQGGKRFEGGGDGGARPNKPSAPKTLADAVGQHYSGSS